MDNQGMRPDMDLLLLWRFYRLLRREQPDVFLGFTVKPNIYGSLACNMLKIPVINNIAGLGAVFTNKSLLTVFLQILYKISHSRSHKVFLQNNDDRKLFIEKNILPRSIVDRVPGSGVDLNKFKYCKNTNCSENKKIRFLLVSRMLWDKGVGEYIEAARLIAKSGIRVEFCLLGFLNVQSPGAISRAQIDKWVFEGIVKYLGASEDVRKEIIESDCVVLPSYYREGVPRALLEAAAIGRPIITTKSIGCKEVVDDEINGYLCKPKNSADLYNKMKRMLMLSNNERELMGLQGRKKMESEFDEEIVITKYLDSINQALEK